MCSLRGSKGDLAKIEEILIMNHPISLIEENSKKITNLTIEISNCV